MKRFQIKNQKILYISKQTKQSQQEYGDEGIHLEEAILVCQDMEDYLTARWS